jgi:hypothetical protein
MMDRLTATTIIPPRDFLGGSPLSGPTALTGGADGVPSDAPSYGPLYQPLLIGSVLCPVLGGTAAHARSFGMSGAVCFGQCEKPVRDSADLLPSPFAHLVEAIEGDTSYDSDLMLLEQALPLSRPDEAPRTDAACDDLPPPSDTSGTALGFLRRCLAEDPSLFMGPCCGRRASPPATAKLV